MDQNNEQWDGVAFMDKWIAKLEEGMKCLKEDHAEQKVLSPEDRAVVYQKEEVAKVVVMMVVATYRSALQSGIDEQTYVNALREQKERAAALNNLRKAMEEMFGGKEGLAQVLREQQQRGSTNG